MNRLILCVAGVAALGMLVSASQSATAAEPQDVSVCELLTRPPRFAGKLVRVQGVIAARFEYFALSDEGCEEAIWIDDAGDPNVQPRPTFNLVRDESYAEFERLISTDHAASVVVVGRFDGVDAICGWKEYRKTTKNSGVVSFHSNGFGHLGGYRSRIVLKQVSSVEPM